MTRNLHVEPSTVHGAVVLRLYGVVDGRWSSSASSLLSNATTSTPPPPLVVVDLSQVDLLTAAGVRLLQAFAGASAAKGVTCHFLVPPGGNAARVFNLADPGRALPRFSDLLECLAARPPQRRPEGADHPDGGDHGGISAARSTRAADLATLATRLLLGLQSELLRRSAEEGFDDIRSRHGAVIACLDENGRRRSELTRLTGRDEPTIGATIDELEELGYVERVPDPAGRRDTLIMPTDRGRRLMELSDRVIADLGQRYAARVGRKEYEQFLRTLGKLTAGAESA